MRHSYKITIPLILLALLILYYPLWEPLSYRFNARDSYYSHGYLIPFVIGYLIWQKRRILKSTPLQPSLWGILLLLPGLVLLLLSLSLNINVTGYFSLPLVTAGLILLLAGFSWLKTLLIPLSFMIFMLPLPSVLIIGIALKMKFMASAIASYLLGFCNIATELSGSKMLYPGGYLVIGDPCSGLRSLITFLALGSLLTQVVSAPLWKKTTLFIAVIPIAILSNVVRIMFLVTLAAIYGSEAASGFWHDFAGMMVFVLAFIGLILTMQGLRCQFQTETA